MTIDQKVLLVDDEVDFTITLAKLLSKRGIAVETANSCSEAIAQMADNPSPVIIMDISMPDVNGIKCLKMIKEQWDSSEVIILTGHACVNTGIEGLKGGAFDYCLKPIDTNELLEKIELACQKLRVTYEASLDPD
jgi:DNA-binding NtrC family response regulator